MELKNLLLEKKAVILNRWFNNILETYPPETAKFLNSQKDRFANPVGSAILNGIENIFSELIAGSDNNKISPFLDNIIRIRAVQDFTPSKALHFIFILKKIIREEIGNIPSDKKISDDLFEFESQIDELGLISFNIYIECREKIYEIRANEIKSRTFRLLQMANILTENQEPVPDFHDNNLINIKRKEAAK